MKKITKTLSIITLSLAIVIALTVFGFYVCLHQRFDTVINKETYTDLVEQIKASKDLPDRFYEMYGLVTEFTENSTTDKHIFTGFLNLQNPHRKNPCPCADASYRTVYGTFDQWTVGLALDKDVSPKKCLDFYLSKFDFLYNTRGIEEASTFYYQKDLEQLNDDEMLELAIMTLNPAVFNKLQHPENLQKKVTEIKTDFHN